MLPPDVEPLAGDLLDAQTYVRELRDCRYVVHCAALYSMRLRERTAIAQVNVTGTASLLAAAHLAGVDRAVVTSSSAAVGHERSGRPADESCWADDGGGAYHDSKLRQERAAHASRMEVVAVLPTAPVGPGDRKPTPTGKMIVDFARGAMIGKPPGNGGMNVVAVEDVARAHVAALERGRSGERYIVGGENVTFDQLWQMLALATGREVPAFRVPAALAFGAAYVDAVRCAIDRDAQPVAPLEGVRMAFDRMYVDGAKTQRELGITPSSVPDALARAVAWFRANGYA